MGVVASVSGEPVGWCACGPRSRYVAAGGGRTGLLKDRDRDEDEAVWLLPCLFLGPGFRGQGLPMRSFVRRSSSLNAKVP